eukprot:TRINITY_DN5479_c0_g1_i1.p1 TRINITY_DN5479_c0_g1~~TRINITY_DN5479_c0_g1_i1.p1  ORF type:complete len:153 (+),score=23.17 TRINITY_DN5479_c0_g1_i1:79-537(+)
MGNYFSKPKDDDLPPPMSPPPGMWTPPSPPTEIEDIDACGFESDSESSCYSNDAVPPKDRLPSPKSLFRWQGHSTPPPSFFSPTRSMRTASCRTRIKQFTLSQTELKQAQRDEKVRLRQEIYAFNSLQTFLEKHKARVHALGCTKVEVTAGV